MVIAKRDAVDKGLVSAEMKFGGLDGPEHREES